MNISVMSIKSKFINSTADNVGQDARGAHTTILDVVSYVQTFTADLWAYIMYIGQRLD